MISRSGAGSPSTPPVSKWQLAGDRLRVGADEEDEHEPDDHDPARREPGDDESVGVEILAGEERPEDERAERGAEERAEEDVGDPARPALGRIHVGGRRAREQDRPLGDADQREPDDDERARTRPRSRALSPRQPTMPATQPPASTGIRPRRSMSRPAGSAASAPAVRKIAGPSPRIPSMPVTRTSVTVATATASWTMPDRHVSVAASRTVFRRIGKPSTGRPYRQRRSQPAPKRRRTAVRGWRTYGPPSRACASLPTAITRRPSESSARNGALASISARVGAPVRARGARDASARRSRGGRRSRSRAPRATAWTIVAVASAGPVPVSCRSEVRGMPETRVPR